MSVTKFGKDFNDLYNEVISKNLCHACGACIVACPFNALDFRKETIYRLELHELEVSKEIYTSINELCEHCGFCYYNCPVTSFDLDKAEKELFGSVSNNALGHFKDAYMARATDKKILTNAQQGGATTAILKYLLDKKYVKAAIVAEEEEIDKWKPKPKIATTFEDLLKAQKTKYTPSPQLIGIQVGLLEWKIPSMALVATPCEIHGLWTLKVSPIGVLKYFDAVRFIIGTFCYGTYSYKDLFLDFLMKKHGFPPSSITKLDLDIHQLKVYVHNELKLVISRDEINHMLRGSCRQCHDFTARLADISVGGVGSPEGWTTVLVRTDRGKKIFEEALDANYIEAEKLPQSGLQEIVNLANKKFIKGVSD